MTLEQQVRERTRDLEVAKERAEKATAVKAEFLSSMSHEIRTPMNAVLGVARLLESTNLSLEQQQYVSMIASSGQVLLSIVNDVLDFSRMEAGEIRLHLTSHNLSNVVESAALQCYSIACAKGLTLSWFIQPDIPPLLIVDENRLQQILLNLLSNAIKFTKKGKVELEVSARRLEEEVEQGEVQPRQPKVAHRSRIPHAASNMSPSDSAAVSPAASHAPPARAVGMRIDLAHSNAQTTESSPDTPIVHHAAVAARWQLNFSVRDTGIGISDQQLSKLFNLFSQVRHSTQYGGTGYVSDHTRMKNGQRFVIRRRTSC
jgi:signal transduction histidine kinase